MKQEAHPLTVCICGAALASRRRVGYILFPKAHGDKTPCFLFYRAPKMNDLMNTYGRLPVRAVKGEGVWLYDEAGTRYLDLVAGVAVNGLGHAHARLVAALAEQLGTLIHCSNLYEIPLAEAAATRVARLAGMDTVFFCNSGCEANEAAIKLARLWAHNKGIANPHVLVTDKSFHGRTLATLSASGNAKIQAGFAPLMPGFVHVPYDDIAAMRAAAVAQPDIVAVLVEPIQGEGGVNVPSVQYLRDVRALCDEMGWLMMLDEIQTGVGRTGTWFAHQHAGIVPDVMSLAKGLGSGVPVGACVARGEAATTFKPGNHGSTFGGNPLACRAVLETLNIMDEDGLLAHATTMGDYLRSEFRRTIGELSGVKDIRGLGLMTGIELDRPCSALVKQGLAHGLLINVTSDTVIRLVPPLILQKTEADLLVTELSLLVQNFLNT